MMLNDLLAQLKTLGIRIWSEQGQLKFSAPKGAMTDALKAQLRDNKAELVALLDRQNNSSVPGIEPSSDNLDEGALSFAQQRLLFMVDAFDMSTAYNMPSLYRLTGSLDLPRLQRSLDKLIALHPSLRTGFVKKQGEFKAQTQESAVLNIEFIDVRSQTPEQQREQLKQTLNREFILAQAPLIHVTCIQSGADEYRLLLNTHHVISDGWSHAVLWRQLWQFYEAPESQVLPPDYGYAHYVNWQQRWFESEDYQRQQQFWQSYLKDVPQVSTLPLDKQRPRQIDYSGAVVPFELPATLTQSLTEYANKKQSSLYIVLLSAMYFAAFKYNGQQDMCIGTSVANRGSGSWDEVVGFFSNVVAVRQVLEPQASLADLTKRIRDNVLTAFEYQDFPFEQVVKHLQVERSLSHSPLFQMMLILAVDEGVPSPVDIQIVNEVVDTGLSKFDLTLTLKLGHHGLVGGIEYSTAIFHEKTIQQFIKHFIKTLEQIVGNDQQTLLELNLLSEMERQQLLYACNETEVSYEHEKCVHQLVLQQATVIPDAVALVDHHKSLTYAQLKADVERLHAALQKRNLGKGQRIGILCERSVDMVSAMIAVMACGAAYVPIDVNFPVVRQNNIIQEADLAALLCGESVGDTAVVEQRSKVPCYAINALLAEQLPPVASEPFDSESLAYIIFTSGSTGRPKGVMLTHRNVHNLFVGLDDALSDELKLEQGKRCFRALTSISFDISVLELFWTLTNGFKVIIEQDHFTALQKKETHLANKVRLSPKAAQLEFSMFYFASDENHLQDKYQLLKEGATFADKNGFSAVWVPERHFHSFGGQFPNPAVAGAAVAALTENIEIRSGSVVLPLHHPMRVAEEWSMVDNLSNGRAALSIASGWHFNDFSLAPENFEDRHQIMRDNIQTLKRLWAGEQIECIDGKGNRVTNRIYPSPVRKSLPIWITAAANPETFKYAGEIGANVLTHLLGQSLTELQDKVTIYREALQKHGFDPAKGKVTLMLHTYIAANENEAMQVVEKPFKDYLRNSLNLLLPVAREQGLDSEDDLEAVVEAGFQRYARTSALFGTPQSCLALVEQVVQCDIDEIACLIDFGVAPSDVSEGFEFLNELRDKVQNPEPVESEMLTLEQAATHMQCTPSYARLLYESSSMRSHLGSLQTLMVGGEALTPGLAKQLNEVLQGNLYNMYGPTETTVWSAVGLIQEDQNHIGHPLANTQLYILDERLNPVPYGVEGMLYIGGDGVAKGYWRREEQTAEAFIANPFVSDPNARMYKTGDIVRRMPDGLIQFVGRKDNQVKIRGHRVELEEIVTVLEMMPEVKKGACIIYEQQPGNMIILAYVVLASGVDLTSNAILEGLREKLPEYMVPGHVFKLDAMPYTPNGKLDVKALPVEIKESSAKMVPPSNDAEFTIADIWRDLLNLTDIGTQDSFFELGGHSLLLGLMQEKLQNAFSIELDIIDLFKYPTIASLANFIETKSLPVTENVKSKQKEDRRAAAAQVRQQMKQRNRRGR